LLATSSWDQTTRLWDPIVGEALAAAPGNFRRFSLDSRQLAFAEGAKIGVWDLAHDWECRTLHPGLRVSLDPNAGFVYGASFSGDDRLLATCEQTGVRLWDVVTGLERSHLDMGTCHPVLFHPDGTSVTTHGTRGTFRWPLRRASRQAEDVLCIGPPEELAIALPSKAGWLDAKWMPGQKGLAMNDRTNASIRVYDLSQPGVSAVPIMELKSEHDRVISVSVSPDGQWIAGGAWKQAGIQILKLPDRQPIEPVLRLDSSRSDLAFLTYFSPDGRWLVSATFDESGTHHGYHFWRSGSWELERFIPAKICVTRAAFADSGAIMALSVSPQQISLSDPADGHEFARVSTNQPIGHYPAALSADGSKLAAITGRQTVLIWDLRRIRHELAKMGLDWEAPSFPSAQPENSRPLNVSVVGDVPIAKKNGQ
jgi:WD40 repeat protein